MAKQYCYTVLLLSLIVLVVSYTQTTNNAFGQASTTYFTVDISGTQNTNDFAYGITCEDSTYRYMGLFSQGALVRINKSNNAVTFFDNNAVASGEDWYSLVTHTPTGKIFINTKDIGAVRIFNPSTGLFTSVSITDNISGGNISYPNGFNDAPNVIAIAGVGTHIFGFDSFGELRYTNNYIWQVADYVRDFSSAEEAAGGIDSAFHGVIRIDPNTLAVTRYSVAGTTALRGLSVDVTDSTILWFTDNNADKLFRFNTNTGLVTDTVSLPVGSKARGVTNDSNAVYVAENKAGNGVNTNKILKILKSGFTISEIDTGVIIGNGKNGVFSVFANEPNDVLIWTDQSNHVGITRLSNTTITTVSNTSGNTSSNHFGCFEGTIFYFAGQGSTVQGSISFGSSEILASSGDSNEWKTKPTFGIDHQRFIPLVYDGFTIDGKSILITDNFHTKYPLINITTGQIHSFKLKSYNPHQLVMHGIGFGCKEAGNTQCETIIEAWYNSDKSLKNVYINQQDELIDKNFAEVYGINKVKCQETDENKNCDETVFILKFNESVINKAVLLQAIDSSGRTQNTWLNEGIFIDGLSLNKAKTVEIGDQHGLIHLTRTDKRNNIWIDEDGIEYKMNEFGTFIRITPIKITEKFDLPITAMTRHHNDFRNLVKIEQEKATQIFDSKMIQKQISASFSHDISKKCERPCNPIPNMMKAITDFEIKKLIQYQVENH